MIFTPEKVAQLYADNKCIHTVHKKKVAILRLERGGPIIAMDTQNGTFYAGMPSPVPVDYYFATGNTKWTHQVGNYQIQLDRAGYVRVVHELD